MSERILIVDDDEDVGGILSDLAAAEGYEAAVEASALAALDAIGTSEFDLVITDVYLGGMDGLELCRRIAESQPDLPVVVITAAGSVDTAVASIRAGAYDFVAKPVSREAFRIAVQRGVAHRALKAEVLRLRDAVASARVVAGILAESPCMMKVLTRIAQVAPTDATVLVTGESGTGKELVARALHDHSPRAGAPFVAVNCGAMPASLLESELFGYVRGAFTDAKQPRRGLFAQADGGTIFLDEMSEMPVEMQVKLLRVLQERRVRPVGADEELAVDVRVVAATNRDLETEIEEHRFRRDLYYRINVVEIELPPLRARHGDIVLLAQHFLERAAARIRRPVAGVSQSAARKLIEYDWPGNVRELENCMERAVALTRFTEITTDDLPERIRDHSSKRLVLAGDDPNELLSLAEMEHRYIRRVLASVGGNKSPAARVLGVDRRSLYRWLNTERREETRDSDGGDEWHDDDQAVRRSR
jgi:two-component system response regulator HydG